MLETVDEKSCNFLQIVRRKGGVANLVVAIARAKNLIAKSDLEHLKALDLENSPWTNSLFRKMGFVRLAKTTSKPEIPEGTKNEAALILLLPSSMLINIDQTPLKYAPVSNQTMAQKGSKQVSVEGSAYKNAITATFGITYDYQFLPIQFIYDEKTLQSLPIFEFPKAF